MLDQRMRRLLEPVLTAGARRLDGFGVTPDQLTLFGAAAGVAAAFAVAFDAVAVGFLLACLSRLADGMDGPLARLRGSSDFGGYLDIVADFVLTGVSFLAFSAVAERVRVEELRDNRSFIFQPGLAEGTETILVYVLMFSLPAWFAPLAWAYATVCAYTALSRSVLAWRLFAPTSPRS